MNDLIEKVKQAMQYCIDNRCCPDNCPYYGDPDGCAKASSTDVLSVIEQMEQEIERLKEQEAVEPKTGHWICKDYDDIFMCSSCEKYSLSDYPYCHWCGAKMEQEGR